VPLFIIASKGDQRPIAKYEYEPLPTTPQCSFDERIPAHISGSTAFVLLLKTFSHARPFWLAHSSSVIHVGSMMAATGLLHLRLLPQCCIATLGRFVPQLDSRIAASNILFEHL